jgi:hypothetical protein
MRLFPLVLEPPSLADQTDDWSRLKRALATTYDQPDFTIDLLAYQTDDWSRLKQVLSTLYSLAHLTIDLPTLRRLGVMLREYDWAVTAVIEMNTWDRPNGPPLSRFVTP